MLAPWPDLAHDSFYTSNADFGTMPSLDEVLDIYNSTIRGKQMSISEAEWNTTVHHCLLKLALKTSVHRNRLDVHTMYAMCPCCEHQCADSFFAQNNSQGLAVLPSYVRIRSPSYSRETC